MKSFRYPFLFLAVVPGSLMAIFCAVAFAQDLSLFFSFSAPSVENVANSLKGMTPGAESGAYAQAAAGALGAAQIAGKTLLRFNCFLSGAGLLLSLILLTLGLQGLRAPQYKTSP